MSASDVRARLDAVRAAIADTGRRPDQVQVVAVTKGHGVDVVHDAAEAGLRVVGESYAQELVAKQDAYDGPDLEWHFVGRLQRNKVRHLVGRVRCIHSVDRESLGAEIAKRMPGLAVYAQVNVSGEPQKGGCEPDDAAGLVDGLRGAGLDVRGLMAVATHGGDAAAEFARLAALADDLGVEGRSMGMSGDYLEAVRAGSTCVRLGTTLFGPRPSRDASGVRE